MKGGREAREGEGGAAQGTLRGQVSDRDKRAYRDGRTDVGTGEGERQGDE